MKVATDPNRALSDAALERLRSESTVFDPAEHLGTKEAMAGYLVEFLHDLDDPALFVEALGVVARARGMSEIARLVGVSRESLYRSLSEKGAPSWETVRRVISVLGLQLDIAPREPDLNIRTIEIVETKEEAVVAKEARVVEEVVVRRAREEKDEASHEIRGERFDYEPSRPRNR